MKSIKALHKITCLSYNSTTEFWNRGEVALIQDQRFLSPSEFDGLAAELSKARQELGWSPRAGFINWVDFMVGADLKRLCDGNT